MTIAVEKLPDCKAKLDIEVPAGAVSTERAQIVAAFSAQAKVPGFRPGHIPQAVIEKRYAKQIQDELSQRLVQQALRETQEKEGLEIIGIGEIEKQLFTPDGAFSISAEVVTAPDFDLPDYQNIEVKAPKVEIDDEQVDSVLERLRQNFAETEDVEGRPLGPGDIAVISWTSTLDGAPLKEAVKALRSLEETESASDETEKAEDAEASEEGDAEAASGQNDELIEFLAERDESGLKMPEEGADEKDLFFLPDFDTQLAGMETGDTRDVTITIEDNFEAEILRGKELVFNVTLKKIQKQILPEINDELAARLEPGNDMAKLRENITKGLEQEQEKARGEVITNQILNAIGGEVDFDLPQHMVFNETQRQVNDMVYQSYQRGAGEDDIQQHQEEIFQSAQQRAQSNLKINFILEEIAKAEKITVSNEELSRHVAMMAAQSGKPMKKVVNQLKQSDGFNAIRHDLLIGKTLEFLREHATITDIEPEEAAAESAAAAGNED